MKYGLPYNSVSHKPPPPSLLIVVGCKICSRARLYNRCIPSRLSTSKRVLDVLALALVGHGQWAGVNKIMAENKCKTLLRHKIAEGFRLRSVAVVSACSSGHRGDGSPQVFSHMHFRDYHYIDRRFFKPPSTCRRGRIPFPVHNGTEI